MDSRLLLQWVQWLLRVLNRSPWTLGRALEELAEALTDPDALDDCPGMMQAWAAVVTEAVQPGDPVRLSAAGFLTKPKRALSERQEVALEVAREVGKVTVKDLRARFPGLSSESYRLDLAALVKKGRLEAVGEKSGRFYQLRD